MIDKIYIVSIDWSTENIDSVLNEINQIGLPGEVPYEVLGVNGYELDNDYLSSNNMGVYTKWNLDNSDIVISDEDNRFWHRDVTDGEIGCALSHITIWEDAYKNGYDNILIYEDDIFRSKEMDWSILLEAQSLQYDLLYLGRMLQNGFKGVVDQQISNTLCRPGYSYQTHAYMLSKSGIKKLVENHLPVYKRMLFPVDEFLPATYTWTPREELNDIFVKDINAFSLNDQVVEQSRNEMFNNSLTQPTDD